MASPSEIRPLDAAEMQSLLDGDQSGPSYAEAEAVLQELASVLFENDVVDAGPLRISNEDARSTPETPFPSLEAKYRALVEQIPAVVFMASLDDGIGEAYVSPQIEQVLGFTQEEWLQDPVRWYRQVHPDDKQRWSIEAAELFLSGKPLISRLHKSL
jgi:PAS domain-containing protein